MTPINPDWVRWIIASLYSHFHQSIEVEQGLQTHMTGERFDLKFRKNTHCEVRVDGPRFKEISKGLFYVYLEVNIFVSVNMGNETPTTSKKHQLYGMAIEQGKVLKALSQAIPILKLGSGINDTGEQLCCLTLSTASGRKDMIEINNYGQIDQNVPLQQSSLEAHYFMECEF